MPYPVFQYKCDIRNNNLISQIYEIELSLPKPRTSQVPVCSCLVLTGLIICPPRFRCTGEPGPQLRNFERKVSGGQGRHSPPLLLVPAPRTSVDWLWGTTLVFHSPKVSPPPMAGAGLRRCPDFPSCCQDLAKPGLGEQTPERLQGYRGGAQGGRGGVRLNGGSGLGQLPDSSARGRGLWGRGLRRAEREGVGQGGPDPAGFSKEAAFQSEAAFRNSFT